MRLRRGAVTAALLAATCASRAARAQYVDWRTSISLAATYSHTATDQPYPTVFTQAGPSMSLTPSLTLLADTPMTSESLVYSATLTLPFTSSFQLYDRPINYGNHFNFTSRITVDTRTTVSVSLGFVEAPINGTTIGAGESAEVPVDFVPAGVDYTVSGSAGVTLNRQISEVLSLGDTATVTGGAAFDPLSIRPRTVSVRNSTSITRQFERDSVALTLGVGANLTTAGQAQNGDVTYPTQSLSNTLTLSWSRQLLESLTLALGAGAAQTVNFANPGTFSPENQRWAPTTSLALTYHRDLATASLSYSHQQQVNLADGSDNLTDSLSLRFSLPAGQTGLVSNATTGFTHNSAVGGVTTSGTNNTFLTDATLLYRPSGWNKLSVSVRGQVSRQLADASAAGIEAATNLASPVTNLTRLAVTLSLTFSYPDSSQVRSVPHLGPIVSASPPEPEQILAPEPVHLELEPPEPEPTPAPAPP